MPVSPDPAVRRAATQIAANTRWAKEPDRTAATSAMRAARLRQFEDQVDPERTLAPDERAKRVKNLQRAHMQRMALKAHQARKRKAAEQRKAQRANGGGAA